MVKQVHSPALSVVTQYDGTLNSAAPLLNSVVATEGCLCSLNMPDNQLDGGWIKLHRTPRLHNTNAGKQSDRAIQRFRIGPIGDVKILDEGTFKGQNVR